MDYEVFESSVVRTVKEMYPDFDVTIGPVKKISNSYTGLIINNNDDIGICFNLRGIYDDEGGNITDEVLAMLYDSIREGVDKSGDVLKSYFIYDYDNARERLFLSTEPLDYDGVMQGYPYKDYGLNFVVAVRILTGLSDGLTSAVVTNKLLESWGISFDKLFEDAIESSQRIMPPKVVPLGRKLGLTDYGRKITYITNKCGMYGASAMFYPGVLEEVAKDFQSDFYILPSSKDGVIAVPCSEEFDLWDLVKIVNMINGSEISAGNFLSSSVFVYDTETKTIKEAG